MRWKQQCSEALVLYHSLQISTNKLQTTFRILLAYRLVSQLWLVWLHSSVVIRACVRIHQIIKRRHRTGGRVMNA